MLTTRSNIASHWGKGIKADADSHSHSTLVHLHKCILQIYEPLHTMSPFRKTAFAFENTHQTPCGKDSTSSQQSS
jgi:hypothetical protein